MVRPGKAMHRDPTLRKRNALVIPGVLLVLACLVGILYAQSLRSDNVTCDDGAQVFVAGACRSATLILVIPLAIGALLIGLGARLRSGETCHSGHGTTATTVLALLIAAVALPAIVAVALYLMQEPGSPYILTSGNIDYSLPRVLGAVAAALGLLALLPYLILYLGTARPPACCREKSCFDPCYCDEEQTSAVAPPIPAFPPPEHPAETAQVTTSPWPGPPKRESHPLVPISAPIVPAEQPPQQLDAPVDDAPLQPDNWPAPPPEPVNDPWAAKSTAPSTSKDPFATPPTTEEGVWTPPAPESEEESEALRARASAAKAKPKAEGKSASKSTTPKKPAKKTTRKVTTKKTDE